MTDLSAESWDHLIDQITYKDDLFRKFIRYLDKTLTHVTSLWSKKKKRFKMYAFRCMCTSQRNWIFFFRNSFRRENFTCDSKCRYEALCFLREGHHNKTLCSHIGIKYGNIYSIKKRTPYLLRKKYFDYIMKKATGNDDYWNTYRRTRKEDLYLHIKNKNFIKKIRKNLLKLFFDNSVII